MILQAKHDIDVSHDVFMILWSISPDFIDLTMTDFHLCTSVIRTGRS